MFIGKPDAVPDGVYKLGITHGKPRLKLFEKQKKHPAGNKASTAANR
jgi:hypothetical protein